jgi:hypothetical protein
MDGFPFDRQDARDAVHPPSDTGSSLGDGRVGRHWTGDVEVVTSRFLLCVLLVGPQMGWETHDAGGAEYWW